MKNHFSAPSLRESNHEVIASEWQQNFHEKYL